MNFEQEIEIYFRSRFTLICIVSFEEERILQQLKEVCEKSRRTLYVWDHADFFQPLTGGGSPPTAKDPLSVLEAIEKMEGDGKRRPARFSPVLAGAAEDHPQAAHLAQRLKYTRKTIVVTLPAPQIPEELKDDSVLLEFLSPGVPELDGILRRLTAKMIAGLWHLPLIRLDVGALFGGLVDQSEKNTRRALALAETVAPCLLWIDEIEKALSAGISPPGTSCPP